MKVLSIIVALGGVVALVLAIIDILAHTYIFGVTGAGYLRGASSLFLLALVIIAYDKCFSCKK